MSTENVELVRQLIPGPDVDVAVLARDEQVATALAEAWAAYYHPDVECVVIGPGYREAFQGLDGLREAWLDWLSPWDSYRSELEDLVDLGDRVVALVRDRGKRKDVEHDVEVIGASVWTVRDGKIARVEFHTRRDAAMASATSDS